MKESCEILVLRWGGQIIAGKITLENGKLSSTAQKGFERLVKSIKEDEIVVDDKKLSPKNDTKNWFKNLPKQYSGSHLRVRMVGENNGNKKTNRSKEASIKT